MKTGKLFFTNFRHDETPSNSSLIEDVSPRIQPSESTTVTGGNNLDVRPNPPTSENFELNRCNTNIPIPVNSTTPPYSPKTTFSELNYSSSTYSLDSDDLSIEDNSSEGSVASVCSTPEFYSSNSSSTSSFHALVATTSSPASSSSSSSSSGSWNVDPQSTDRTHYHTHHRHRYQYLAQSEDQSQTTNDKNRKLKGQTSSDGLLAHGYRGGNERERGMKRGFMKSSKTKKTSSKSNLSQNSLNPISEGGFNTTNSETSIDTPTKIKSSTSFSVPGTSGLLEGESKAKTPRNHRITSKFTTGDFQKGSAVPKEKTKNLTPGNTNSLTTTTTSSYDSETLGRGTRLVLRQSFDNTANSNSKTNFERERERVQEWHQNLKEKDGGSGDLVINEVGDQLTVCAGTKEKLIERLTYEKYPDPRYAEAFLLTYRAFITPLELLEGIIKRYHIPQPPNMEKEVFVREKQTPIRLRSFLVLKTWMEKHFATDFIQDEKLIERLREFIANDLTLDAPTKSMPVSLTNVLNKQLELSKANSLYTKSHSRFPLAIDETKFRKPESDSKPPCLPPSFMMRATLLSFGTRELAEQMSLIEFHLYRKIEPKECLHQGWNKKEKSTLAPNISAMISYFNFVAAWVSTEIVSISDITRRAITLAKFIDLSEDLKKLGNFNAFTEVIAGLESTAVFRLKKTWELLTPVSLEMYRTNKALLDSNENFTLLRNAMREQELPSIPYLGVFLTDLTFIQEGNTDLYLETELINFRKLSLIADVILQIQRFQETPYQFPRNEEITEYFENLDVLNEKNLLEHSLQLEPRRPKGPKQGPPPP